MYNNNKKKQNNSIIIGKSLFKKENYKDNLKEYKLFNLIKERYTLKSNK
jgi:hypothetical protein